MVEHFCQPSGLPHLLLIVHYRPIKEARPLLSPRPRPADSGVRAELSEPERELFDRRRAWRNGRAQAEGVPPYVLLTNRQVAAVAHRRPETLAALRKVEGIGEAKSNRFGRELLAVVAHPPPAAAPPPERYGSLATTTITACQGTGALLKRAFRLPPRGH